MANFNVAASNFVPTLDCDALKVNLQIDGIMNGLSGAAENYGAFRAAVAITQDKTVNGVDPRDCSNKIHTVTVEGDDYYGVNIQWHTPDCDVFTNNTAAFTCAAGETSTPTESATVFAIKEHLGANMTIGYKDWLDSCCGVEEYYRKVVEMRDKGNTGGQIASMINGVSTQPIKERSYEIGLIAEKIKRTMDAPITGQFAIMNEAILNKINDAAGYNHVKDATTGVPVGNAVWEVPVLYSTSPGCPDLLKRIDTEAYRREMTRFIRTNPRCATGFSIIGGYKFLELEDERGSQAGIDQYGVDKAYNLQKALGLRGNFYLDTTIDDVFAPGTFFIVEDNSLALFWLALHEDRNRRLSTLNGQNGYHRSMGLMTQTFRNCRGDAANFLFDTFISARTASCLSETVYDFQYRARWDLFTRPAVGCDNPQTGIYAGLLTDVCA
jgi:hypothetical protein